MNDFANLSHAVLGEEMKSSLLHINESALHHVLGGIFKKIMEFQNRCDKMEFELDGKATKVELSATKVLKELPPIPCNCD